jgi:hypothetical protein
MRNRRQITGIGKYEYSFVNKTIRHWNRFPAEILGNLSLKANVFRKSIRKVTNVLS